MRKDDSGSFRGSVFVTFADPACARTAASNPPLQLGSSSERLLVMLRPDYDRKVHGGGVGGGSGKKHGKGGSSHRDHGTSGGGGGGSAQKRG
jgi:hypothetical protein